MGKKLLDWSPSTGIAEYHTFQDGVMSIETVQDVRPVLERNERKRNSHNTSRFQDKGDYYHFASVPLTVLLDWKTKYGIDWNRKEDLPKIEKLLMSNEYKYLRTVDRI